MPAPRYFVEDQPELTARLDAFLGDLGDDLPRQPWMGGASALLLAGGYGRGEGGVFREAASAAPQLYNDLEFYLVAEGPAGPRADWVRHWSRRGEERLGIEVEFKIIRSSFLRGEPSMFFYDLLVAHRPVWGQVAGPPRLLDPTLIPPHEATRLLFNRGSGLFFSRVALERGDERSRNGFVERNHAKVRLALADAVLALNGRYHFSCLERNRRLGESLRVPPDWATIRPWHAEGVEFKLRPWHLHPEQAALHATQAELTAVWQRTFLWVEAEHLRHPFAEASAYAGSGARLFPHTPRWRNAALHLRDRIRRGTTLPGWLDYPRAALQRALVLLLAPVKDLPQAARRLGLAANPALDQIHTTYEQWWKRYN